MSFRIAICVMALMVASAWSVVSLAGTPVVHFDQDFTDGSLTAEVGSLTGIHANLALRTQQSWRNPLQTYFGPSPATAFDSAQNVWQNSFSMTLVNSPVLQSGNVWVLDMSIISDVATNKGESFNNTPGPVIEGSWDNGATGLVAGLKGAVANSTAPVGKGGMILATSYPDGVDSTLEPTLLGNSLTDANLPSALDGVLRAKYVYQPLAGGASRVNTQALDGDTPTGSAARNIGVFRTDYSGGLSGQLINNHGSGNVTYSAGHGGGVDVPYNAALTNLQLGLTRLTFKQVQNTDFNTDGATNSSDGTILAANIGTNKSFFDGDVNGDSSVKATDDGFAVLQTIGGAAGTASAKLNSATGEILLTSSNVSFVELISAGGNLIPGSAVSLGSVPNASFHDAPAAGMINYAGLTALGSGGSLANFSIGAVLPNGFSNLADLQLRYLNGSTEVFANVTLATIVPGDFNGDGDVDGEDFATWQDNFPTSSGASVTDGDADGDGDVDGADFVVWQTNYPSPAPGTSSVPEPSAWILAIIVGVGSVGFGRHRRCH